MLTPSIAEQFGQRIDTPGHWRFSPETMVQFSDGAEETTLSHFGHFPNIDTPSGGHMSGDRPEPVA
jgi:hypothetical protein